MCPTKGNPWPGQIRRCTEYLSGKWSDGLLPAQKGGGRGKIRGWHYSTNCGNGSKVGLSGPDDCMEIDPTVTPQDLLCPPPDILKVGNPILNISKIQGNLRAKSSPKSNGLALQHWYDLGSVQAVHNRLLLPYIW